MTKCGQLVTAQTVKVFAGYYEGLARLQEVYGSTKVSNEQNARA